MEPKTHNVIFTYTYRPPRYAAVPVVVPDYKRDEKRLVPAAPKETCKTKTRQNSPNTSPPLRKRDGCADVRVGRDGRATTHIQRARAYCARRS